MIFTLLQSKWSVLQYADTKAGEAFKAKYALAVSFEAVDQNIEIYERIRLSNQVEVNVDNPEIRVEINNFTEGR